MRDLKLYTKSHLNDAHTSTQAFSNICHYIGHLGSHVKAAYLHTNENQTLYHDIILLGKVSLSDVCAFAQF